MNAVVKAAPSNSVIVRMATRFGVDPDKMLHTLKATAFKGDASVEQLMALCVVADQYELNPWTKEIYAFPDKGGGIVPVVGVDGWSRIINSNPQFDGMDFVEGELNGKSIPSWIECRIHRKDRQHPICVKEYFDEVYRQPKDRDGNDIQGPWQTHPRRMLRHKAMIQCARLAFGFVGVYDEDEAQRIIDVTPVDHGPRPDTSNIPPDEIDRHVAAIASILNNEDDKYKDEYEQAKALRDYAEAYLNTFSEVYSAVFDALAKRKIITKGKFREFLALLPPDERHGAAIP